VPQDNSKASMAPLLKKDTGLIDWTMSAREIHNRVRGLSPWPGAFSFLDGAMVKVLETEVVPGSIDPERSLRRERTLWPSGREKSCFAS